MNYNQTVLALLGLISELNSIESWSGETHIQKTFFMWATLNNIDLDLDYTIYKYGPYSFKLHDLIETLKNMEMVNLKTYKNYGPSILLSENGRSVLNKLKKDITIDEDAIKRVCADFGKKNVGELEKISTAVFLLKNSQDKHSDALVCEMQRIKPHINRDDIAQAMQEGRQLLSA